MKPELKEETIVLLRVYEAEKGREIHELLEPVHRADEVSIGFLIGAKFLLNN